MSLVNAEETKVSINYREMPVGQLAAERPARARVFERFGIEYCCGGGKTLEESCQRRSVNVDEVVQALIASDEQKDPAEKDWTTATLKELVEHIVEEYHEPLRREMPRVRELAEKVARVHGENHPEMVKLLNIYRHFNAQMALHMEKEEMMLFPAIVSQELEPQTSPCGGNGIQAPISIMMQEHEEAGEALEAMSQLTNGYTPPPDACNSFRVLLDSLDEINREMFRHVHKENNILFPRALGKFQKTAPSTCQH